MNRAFALAWSGAAVALMAGEPGAQAPPAGLPMDSVAAYSGVYRVGPNGVLAVSAHRAPFGVFPLLSDIRTGTLRLLLPAGRDTFVAGTELAGMQQIERRIVFRRDPRGRVAGLDVSEIAAPSAESARRQKIRQVAIVVRRDSITLPGTLFLPASAAHRVPAVVFAHGSEDSDRYSFGALPLVLAHYGIASFVYDKRGTGSANGSWETAGIEELALDLGSAIARVRGRPEIDPARVCVLGFSEGAWVAPRAAHAGGVACIVGISGGGRMKGDTYIYKLRRVAEEQGLQGASLDSAVTAAAATIQASAARVRAGEGSGFDRRVMYDPSRDWRAFTGPVLILLGEYDVLEDASASATWLRSLFSSVRHTDHTVRVFPAAHHGLLFGASPHPSSFARMRGVQGFAPGYWESILWWLTTRLDPRRPAPRASPRGERSG